MTKRLQLIVFNELSLVHVLWAKWQGRQPILMDVDSHLPILSEPLIRLRDWLIKRDWARSYASLDDEFKAIETYWPRVMFYDVFGDTEAWQDQYFEVDNDAPMHGYDYAEHHVICNFAKSKHVTFLVARKLHEQGIPFDLVGAPHDTASGLAAYASSPQPSTSMFRPVCHRVLNIAITLFTLLYTYFWILRRVRVTQPSEEPVFFAADYNGDPRDHALFEDIQSGGRLLVVPRNAHFQGRAREINVNDKIIASLSGCHTSISCALQCAAMATRDILSCYVRRGYQRTGLFSHLIKLPFKRAQYRIFFDTYRPKFYWGRDDYNEQHIIRRQELRRIGGVSLGLNHGYSHYANVYPMWRCISFDIFYTFGRAQYDGYTRGLWANDMVIRTAGPFGVPKAAFHQRNAPKPQDIAVFCSAFITVPQFMDLVHTLAEAFPEKIVWLQLKSIFIGTPDGDAFIAACSDKYENIKYTNAPIYEIFQKAQYVFSDPSTIIVEAAHYGCKSFFADVFPEQKRTLFRDFPEICIRSGTDAVQMINKLENDGHIYPLKDLATLVINSEDTFYDIVREDLGLAKKRQLDHITRATVSATNFAALDDSK
tara:strand:- start:8419 stop:10206 length:1788 start_codon:yes stop_codon:yes gene_type:complete